ncbi:MAG: hypothetical protein ACFFD4_11155 [Candidatus Odinarchaeota archaeon]
MGLRDQTTPEGERRNAMLNSAAAAASRNPFPVSARLVLPR